MRKQVCTNNISNRYKQVVRTSYTLEIMDTCRKHFVLCFFERCDSIENEKYDNRVFIIIVPDESYIGGYHFECYGSRRSKRFRKLKDYAFTYPASRSNQLINQLSLLNNEWTSKVDVELHSVYMGDNEYLDFETLDDRISNRTEMWAYDDCKLTNETCKYYLDLLINW